MTISYMPLNVQCTNITSCTMMQLTGKGAPNDHRNDPDRLKVKTYPYGYYTNPRGPNFHPFHSAMSRFRVIGKFCEKCTEWLQNDLDLFKIKSTHMHTAYTNETRLFIRFALYQEQLSSYAPVFGKVHRMTPNDLDIFKVNHMHTKLYYIESRDLNFRLFHSAMSGYI